MQNPLANFIAVFSLVRDDRGFQVNPLCRHDITSPFPPSGNEGYVRNLGVFAGDRSVSPFVIASFSYCLMWIADLNYFIKYSTWLFHGVCECFVTHFSLIL